ATRRQTGIGRGNVPAATAPPIGQTLPLITAGAIPIVKPAMYGRLTTDAGNVQDATQPTPGK
ncbi:MAG: hypothetical protein KC433_25260, partial [Anaerolineales bacterium]|nr:hypothetical protein [Anaerolineales bacterium]